MSPVMDLFKTKFLNNHISSTLSSYLYTRVLPGFRSNPLPQTDLHSSIQHSPIAIICDEMTWQSLLREHPLLYLTPRHWKEAFKAISHKPRLLLCEAAWSGRKYSAPCWRGQVYRDRRVRYENRRELLHILDYCKAAAIPTVFWAKEDPAYFLDPVYDFTDTALRFDHILTTSEECISRYYELGHGSVHLWPFGFSPALFYPPEFESQPRERAAVFAGSWYPDQPERCADMSALFDYILSLNIQLYIYDRNRNSGTSTKPFPKQYQPFVKDAVDYESLGNIYRGMQYAININTTKDSVSMFARRVYEAMACGAIVISNDSTGLRAQFGKNIWFAGENFDHFREEQIRVENINEVFAKHTWKARLAQLWDISEQLQSAKTGG